jgi:hypothetical protein
MGVYCDVHVCVKAPGPLDAEVRGRIVEICRKHELLRERCHLAVPEAVQPRGVGEWIRAKLLGRALEPSLAKRGLQPYGGLHPGRGLRTVRDELAGPWLPLEVRRLGAADLAIGCGGPKWAGDVVDGGFIYLALQRPTEVKIFNAYQPLSVHDGDGVIGSFHDVLSLSAKRDLDGRKMAGSAFARELKRELGLQLTCRASWW